MKTSTMKIITGLTLIATLISTTVNNTGVYVNAASRARLATKNINVKKGSKISIIIKNRNKKAKYSYSSSKPKIASVSKKGIVTGKQTGTAKITVKERLNKKIRNLGTIKVKVTLPKTSQSTPAASAINTTTIDQVSAQYNNTATSAPANTAAATPSPTPEATVAPTKKPLVFDDTSTPEDFNIKKNDIPYGTSKPVTYHSHVTGTDRRAIVITPPDYDPDEKYPVLYLCHGGNGDENDWFNMGGTPDIIYGNLLASGDTVPMIMVLVNCRARADDRKDPADSLSHEHMKAWTDFLTELQEDLMPYISREYPILEGRENTGIAGFSMGGRESLYIGFSIPDKIGYIGAFSPAFGIFEYENWGLHEDGYFTEESFTLSDEYMDNTICMIINGNEDDMVRDEPERYHNALVKNGVNHYYYTIPGKHDMNVWRNGLYHFLKIVFR